MSALIEFEEVCKYYQMGDTTVKAADHITMKIDKGESLCLQIYLRHTIKYSLNKKRAPRRMPFYIS